MLSSSGGPRNEQRGEAQSALSVATRWNRVVTDKADALSIPVKPVHAARVLILAGEGGSLSSGCAESLCIDLFFLDTVAY